jgi:ribosomal RNA-processing protein 9
MEWLPGNRQLVTGSKDCSILLWDVETGKKTELGVGRKFDRDTKGHFDEVCTLAVSDNGKYLISGGKDRLVRVWDLYNQKLIESFLGHRDTITACQFDKENDQFYTAANDRCLKVWNLRAMAPVDSHYGHLSDVLGMQKYSKDRIMTCGLDRQVIFWKVNEDSELLYRNTEHYTDTLNIVTPQLFLTGSHTDNCLDLWTMNKKRPLFTLGGCHASGTHLLSTDTVHNSDIVATGGFDGLVNLYKVDKEERTIAKLSSIPGVQGCVNSLKFSKINR